MAFIKRTPEKKEEIKKILNMKKNDDDDDDYDKGGTENISDHMTLYTQYHRYTSLH